jgi:pyruvate formate lyase activating enzyme
LVLSGDAAAGAGKGFSSLDDALALIQKRKRVLGGVVISGGEPAIHPALGELIGRIHDFGLPVKLDTNGLFPPVLRELLENPAARPDYIAMDLKLAPRRYGELLPGGIHKNPAFDPEALAESAAMVRDSGVEHEFRSLALPEGYFGPEDITALAPLAGDSPWNIRPFVPGNCLEPAWNSLSATDEKETAPLAEMIKRRVI